MSQVWEKDLNPTTQSILLCLADFASDNGDHCYPSVSLIAWKVGVSKRTVQRCLDDLREKKILTIKKEADRARHIPAHYLIDLTKASPKPPFSPGDNLSFPKSPGDIDDNLRVTPTSSGRVTSETPPGDTAMSPNTPVEPLDYPPIEPPLERGGDFDEFWKLYPRHTGCTRAMALKSFKKNVTKPTDMDAIRLHIAHSKTTRKWLEGAGQFISMPTTYLNNRMWEEEITVPARDEETLVDDDYGWSAYRADQAREDR